MVGWVLDPRTETFVAVWDLVTTFALLYVALVTPVEVAFIEPPPTLEEQHAWYAEPLIT